MIQVVFVVTFRAVPAIVTVYKSMYAVSLKSSSSTKPSAAELCHLLCDTLQQVGQLQQQLNEDKQHVASLGATGT